MEKLRISKHRRTDPHLAHSSFFIGFTKVIPMNTIWWHCLCNIKCSKVCRYGYSTPVGHSLHNSSHSKWTFPMCLTYKLQFMLLQTCSCKHAAVRIKYNVQSFQRGNFNDAFTCLLFPNFFHHFHFQENIVCVHWDKSAVISTSHKLLYLHSMIKWNTETHKTVYLPVHVS